MKPIRRWKKKAGRVVQRLLPFFTNSKKQRAFERWMKRRDDLETRDARLHDTTVRTLMEKGFSRQEAERLAASSDHTTRHPHDVSLLGRSRKEPRDREHKEMPRTKRSRINWNIWRRK